MSEAKRITVLKANLFPRVGIPLTAKWQAVALLALHLVGASSISSESPLQKSKHPYERDRIKRLCAVLYPGRCL